MKQQPVFKPVYRPEHKRAGKHVDGHWAIYTLAGDLRDLSDTGAAPDYPMTYREFVARHCKGLTPAQAHSRYAKSRHEWRKAWGVRYQQPYSTAGQAKLAAVLETLGRLEAGLAELEAHEADDRARALAGMGSAISTGGTP